MQTHDLGQQHIAHQRRATLAAALAALVGGADLAIDNSLFADGDTSWHIAAGRWILQHGTVPTRDPFSYSMPGTPWHAHEWLAEVPMALLFDAGGWAALSLLFAGAFTFTLFVIGRELGRTLPARWVVAVLAAVFAILFPATLARPHLLGWALLAFWVVLLVRARDEQRAPPLAAALLMIVWANLHASFIIGLGLAGVFAFEAFVEERSPARTLRVWLPFGLLSLAASLVTPFGLQAFVYPFQVSRMEALSTIAEWHSVGLVKDGLFLAYLVSVAGLALLGWRRVGWVRLALLALLAAMALMHGRHQAIFALVAPLAVLPRAALRFTGRDRPFAPSAMPRDALLVLGIGLALIAGTRLAFPLTPDDPPGHMGGAFEAVPPELRQAPVFNSYSFGGPLILRGVRPFIDGRADMYGDAFTLEYHRIAAGDMAAFRRAEQRYGFRWTILWTPDKLAEKLDREPGWRRIYTDDFAIVHVREGSTPRGR